MEAGGDQLTCAPAADGGKDKAMLRAGRLFRGDDPPVLIAGSDLAWIDIDKTLQHDAVRA